MQNRDYRDIIGGLLIILAGGFAAAYALANLNLGTLSHMGPGMVPAAIGIIMCGLGLGIAVPALFRSGHIPRVEVRPLLMIFLSILLFALTIRRLGMIPSVMLVSLVASLADEEFRPVVAVVTAVLLSISVYLIFGLALRVHVPVVAWPW